jgi:hypothetical protein
MFTTKPVKKVKKELANLKGGSCSNKLGQGYPRMDLGGSPGGVNGE